ncbi:MAG TPA: riboflavin synthase [Caldilineae bacterium]|jgi:riboflavin synthase|nr:riboflavin synthase [Caldilineae bacterium]
MFSGIVEEVGMVRRLERRGGSATLEVAARQVLQGTRVGDSIAINGVCLTVTTLEAGRFTVDLVPETLRRTNLGRLCPGSRVNLERSLCVGERIGGHFVQGHVDGVGRVVALVPEEDAIIARFSAPPSVMRYIVPKGFIAVDGVSLTVVDRLANGFTVSLIPYTMAHTIAGRYQVGDVVNLEVDILGKYVERFLLSRKEEEGLSREFLARHGFAD